MSGQIPRCPNFGINEAAEKQFFEAEAIFSHLVASVNSAAGAAATKHFIALVNKDKDPLLFDSPILGFVPLLLLRLLVVVAVSQGGERGESSKIWQHLTILMIKIFIYPNS